MIVAVLIATIFSSAGAAPAQDDFKLPPPATAPQSPLQLWATHYYVHTATELPEGVPLRNKAGEALTGPVSPRDWCLGAIEGTVQVGKDMTLNYAGAAGKSQVDCAAVLKINPVKQPWITSTGKSYFTKARGAYGDGVAGFVLVPLRTIAVDRKKIAYGTVLYIPQARGLDIATSSTASFKHDGYFFAGDTGGAIKGNHIDVFCGNKSESCLPALIKSDSKQTFEAFVVNDPQIKATLQALHKP